MIHKHMDTYPPPRVPRRTLTAHRVPPGSARGLRSSLSLVWEDALQRSGGWGVGFVDSLGLSGTRGQEPGGRGAGETLAVVLTSRGPWAGGLTVLWCRGGVRSAWAGEVARTAAPPAVPPGVLRPLAHCVSFHSLPSRARPRVTCAPGCTSPDSGQVSSGVHSCVATSGDPWGAGRVLMTSGAADPGPVPGGCVPALCSTRTRILFDQWGVGSGPTLEPCTVWTSTGLWLDAGCSRCRPGAEKAPLSPGQAAPRGEAAGQRCFGPLC